MTYEFMACDLRSTSVAFAIFSLFSVIPGYVLGSWMNLFEFGRRSFLAQIAVAVSLSVAVVPVTLYLSWRCFPALPWISCAVCWLVFPLLFYKNTSKRYLDRQAWSKYEVTVVSLTFAWVILGMFSLVDLQIGTRLYLPITSYDYALRTAFTAAIERTGVPPVNPYFYPGHGYILRYHYFWYMICGLVGRLGGSHISPRVAVNAGTLWSGIALVAIVTLYVYFFHNKRTGHPEKQMLVAVALLSISGLDILPLILIFVLTGRFNASSAWWNEPVLSWMNSIFWQPHSVASLVACATGLLIIRHSSRCSAAHSQWWSSVVAGAAFASGIGLSIYVAFVFGMGLLAWAATLLLRRSFREAKMIGAVLVVMVVLSSPYMFELFAHGSAGPPNTTKPITFAVRSFYLAESLTNAFGVTTPWAITAANLVSLPLNYFLEFGFFAIVALTQYRRLRAQPEVTEDDLCAVVMLTASVLICSFLRSNTISSNDLGWRGIVVAQFILLLWASELWDKQLLVHGRRYFNIVGLTLLLGATATIYDLAMLRIYPILLDDLTIPRYHWLAPDHHLGERTYALRELYEGLDQQLPADAVVQHNPNAEPEDLFNGLYGNRQTVAETQSCSVVFGGSPALCEGILKQLNPVFSAQSSLTVSNIDSICRQLSINALVIKDTDPVWKDKGSSWVWHKKPVEQNAYARAFLCGASEDPPRKP